EPGITIARSASSRAAVVGADVMLDNLSTLLRSQPVAPSTELFLMTDDDHVLAYRNGATAVSHAVSGDGPLRLRTLEESAGRAVPALKTHFGSRATDSRMGRMRREQQI